MSDRPILFSGPMVNALLDGRKTQTRRLLKPAKHSFDNNLRLPDGSNKGEVKLAYAPGDRLWVRERFAISGIGWGITSAEARGGRVHYHADPEHGWNDYWGNWRPSIHMPRWASRLTLAVTEVRVQRLQEISGTDAIAEGIEPVESSDSEYVAFHARTSFQALWDSLNADRAPWASNPWVVALTFTVQRGNIDQVGDAA